MTLLIAFLTTSILSAPFLFGGGETEAEAASGVSFSQDIQPLLQRSCQGCHQPASRQGGLDVTNFENLRTRRPARRFLRRGSSGEEPSPGASHRGPGTADAAGHARPGCFRYRVCSGNGSPRGPGTTPRRWQRGWPAGSRPCTGSRPSSLLWPTLPTAARWRCPVTGKCCCTGTRIRNPMPGWWGPPIGSSPWVSPPTERHSWAAGGRPASFGEVQFWDLESAQLRRAVRSCHDTLFGASLSPDGDPGGFRLCRPHGPDRGSGNGQRVVEDESS